ncbi:MAG: class I SAM-dependent methyltransferase [Acidobacteriota bacterium]
MTERVCPWWLGYLLASPVRGWLSGWPEDLLGPYLEPGATVVEPGPGMGFFTLPMARMVGEEGRVIAVDIQPEMLEGLRQRVRKAGLEGRVEARLGHPESLGLADMAGAADFLLAFAVVHEAPQVTSFFGQAAAVLRPGGTLLLAEPLGHVDAEAWQRELKAAEIAGLAAISRPKVRRSRAVLFRKV